ncbi:hypothetical protein FRC02_010312 [Tulasnella sp. 418]|nr:hypothetical protein FRC02_010312 [Tulasnella sp. 418]
MELHHQHHPPLPPTSHYQPPSPASSTNSSNNEPERLPKELNKQYNVGNVDHHLYEKPNNSQDSPGNDDNSSYVVNSSAAPGFPPPHHHFRRIPTPPEPSAFNSNQQPASWPEYPYVPSGAVSPPSQPSFPSSSTLPWNPSSPHPPEETTSAEPMPQHPSDPLPAPVEPQSPTSPPQESINLSSPTAPYHPHLQYPIPSPPPPNAGQQSNRTYSFVSLPGNALRKRPRRKYEEIERLYSCNYQGCTKSYGTLNHLNAHVTMQRHGPKRTPGEFKEMRKQWKRRKKELAEDDEHDPDIGPSSSGRSAKRKRRATEPVLPSVSSLGTSSGMISGGLGRDSGEDIETDQNRVMPLEHHNLELHRRVSMDEYNLPVGERRDSGASGEAEETIDELSDEGSVAGITLSAVGTAQSQAPLVPGSAQSGGPGIHGRHGGHIESPIVPSSRAALPHLQQQQHAGNQQLQYWQTSSHQASMAHPSSAQQPLSPNTVAPHVSHLPGPGPVPSMSMSHHHPANIHRQPSYPPSYQPPQMVHSPYPPVTPVSTSHHSSVTYPPPAQPQSPPAPHPSQSGVHHLVHLSPAPQAHVPSSSTGNAPPSHSQSQSQHHIQMSSPPMQRLHPSSTLLTPLNPGNPHRHESISMTMSSNSNMGVSGPSATSGSSGSSIQSRPHYGSAHGQGLPSVFELTREPVEEEGTTSGGSGHPPQGWESYSQQATPRNDPYSGGLPSHQSTQRSEGYSVPPREQYPPVHRAQQEMYSGRGDHYSHQQSMQRSDLGQYVTPPPPHYSHHRQDPYSTHMGSITAGTSHTRQESYAPSSRGEPYPPVTPTVPSSHQEIRGAGHHQTQQAHPHYGSRGHPGPNDNGYLQHPH